MKSSVLFLEGLKCLLRTLQERAFQATPHVSSPSHLGEEKTGQDGSLLLWPHSVSGVSSSDLNIINLDRMIFSPKTAQWKEPFWPGKLGYVELFLLGRWRFDLAGNGHFCNSCLLQFRSRRSRRNQLGDDYGAGHKKACVHSRAGMSQGAGRQKCACGAKWQQRGGDVRRAT